ncbi:MAG: iron ABC transporter permease [Halobacteria archaeon]
MFGGAPLTLVVAVLAVLLGVSVTGGVTWGSVPISPTDVWSIVWSKLFGGSAQNWPQGHEQIVWELRLPRVFLAAVVGAALTVAGTVIQALVRNPLADPFILGLSAGASVGAAGVILLGALGAFGIYAISVGGFLGALVAMVAVFAIAQERGRINPLRLVLVGVAMAFVFQAITGFLVFWADPRASQAVLFWLLGSFGRASWSLLAAPAIVLILGLLYAMARARSTNALSLGEEAALSLGVDVAALRRGLFVTASLMTGVAVAASGAIGFVGLVVPHMTRLLFGSDHRAALPVGALLGASFMVWGDLLARTIVAPQEMPIGVITAFLGAPFFLLLLRRSVYSFGSRS